MRENEVFYLPGESEGRVRKRRRVGRNSLVERVRTQSGSSGIGKKVAGGSRASTPSGSTDGGSAAGFARRRGTGSVASSVAGGDSSHDEDSETESTATGSQSKPPVSDAGSHSTSASSAARSPRKRTLSTRTRTRSSRRLNPDAAEFAPGHVEAAQEEQDQEDDVAPESGLSARRKGTKGALLKKGAKRTRTVDDLSGNGEGPRPKRTRTNTGLRKSVSVSQVNGKT